MKLDQERKQKQEINESIQEEVQSMVTDRKEPTEVKYRRQIHLELSSLRSISRESSFPSDSEVSENPQDETMALLLVARRLERDQAEKQQFELKYLPGQSSFFSISCEQSGLINSKPFAKIYIDFR